jgi:predicted AlkP superfamily pyrophosphatase or phosphodiesterase
MRLAVLNMVGLSRSLIGGDCPALRAFAAEDGLQSFAPSFPAVTCTAQSGILTGGGPGLHGVVGNGWYDREYAEMRFWKQSNHIVRAPKIWETLRAEDPSFTCAKLFWWYNMHAGTDIAVTPRPLYPADGRKVFDIHTTPMSLRGELKGELGEFPFPSFWGPRAGIASSEWIAACARRTERVHAPSLSLVYLPHLDYVLQKDGPASPRLAGELRAIDRVFGELLEFYRGRGVKVMVVSEYGISEVGRPLHLNRLFRARGWLSLKDELGRETLDCGGCRVFAVADHQVAHVYVNDVRLRDEVRSMLEETPGVEEVRVPAEMWGAGPAVERAGDFIAVAAPDAWFTYYFWEDDSVAPDYARTIDIHRKPGYDPCELFLDPALRFPGAKVASFLLKKRLGFRALMEVVPLDASLVRGSHGRDRVAEELRPVVIGADAEISDERGVHQAILAAARWKAAAKSSS